jgi:hypothetical protein
MNVSIIDYTELNKSTLNVNMKKWIVRLRTQATEPPKINENAIS